MKSTMLEQKLLREKQGILHINLQAESNRSLCPFYKTSYTLPGALSKCQFS